LYLATKYKLDVSTDPQFGIGNFVTGYEAKEITETNEMVSGLEAEKVYYYRVKSVDASLNESPYTDVAAVKLAGNPPLAMAATSILYHQFEANWDPITAVDGYTIDVSTASDFSTFVSGFENLDVSNNTSLLITDATEDTTYYYRVRAYVADGSASIDSNTITVVVPKQGGVSSWEIGIDFKIQ